MPRGRPPKWRVCPRCRRRKLIAEDFYHWFERNGRERVARQCKECRREIVRLRYAAIMADPYLRRRELERKASWEVEQRKRERNPDRCRRYREKLKAERPEVYQQQLEDARIRRRLRNERLGVPKGKPLHPVKNPPPLWLPVEPLLKFLRANRIESMHGERDLYRVLHETATTVSLPVADRIITRAGYALPLVYPELYA